MQREKKGFSIELFTKEDVEDYTVYFETKHDKVIFCYIQDSFLEKTFKGKAVCHELDHFSKSKGMELAFEKALEKRFYFYNSMMNKVVHTISVARDHDIKIENKFKKFLTTIK
jgi:hypothetical protein